MPMIISSASAQSGDLKKWRGEFLRFGGWSTPSQRRIQALEARRVAHWLLERNLVHYPIIEIGCGDGFVGLCIIRILQKHGKTFSYHFTDLLPECIDAAQKNVAGAGLPVQGVQFSTLDIFCARKTLGLSSCAIIVSTGFASAATYKDAVPEVVALLQPGGILIADFVNHLSLFSVLLSPWQSVLRFREYLKSTGKYYHFGILGIRDFFGENGLHLVRHSALRMRRNPILCMFEKRLSETSVIEPPQH